MPGSTMCVCGDMQQINENWGADNVFLPHNNRRTGEPCPGLPQPRFVRGNEIIDRLAADVDLTGLLPEQAYSLGQLTGELLKAAEARGYRIAIAALRDAAKQQNDNDGFVACTVYDVAASYLESITKEDV